MTPSRTWRSVNGSIILCSSAMRRIQWSGLTDIHASDKRESRVLCLLLKEVFRTNVELDENKQCIARRCVLTTRGGASSIGRQLEAEDSSDQAGHCERRADEARGRRCEPRESR